MEHMTLSEADRVTSADAEAAEAAAAQIRRERRIRNRCLACGGIAVDPSDHCAECQPRYTVTAYSPDDTIVAIRRRVAAANPAEACDAVELTQVWYGVVRFEAILEARS